MSPRSRTGNLPDKVMSHTVTGRYRKAALAIAKAKGEEAKLKNDVYNYGDMLFQEAEMTRERRDAWRRQSRYLSCPPDPLVGR